MTTESPYLSRLGVCYEINLRLLPLCMAGQEIKDMQHSIKDVSRVTS
jgi:hypothetical protein